MQSERELRHALKATDILVQAIQELSMARTFAQIQGIVRHAARAISGSDGATLVLRDGEQCHYVDEDAIAPLWKGKRFPLSACISGWSMLHKQPVMISDIYADPRIPHDAYRPTFVRSLLMVPIRTANPIGAIGNYWAYHHTPTAEDAARIQALADTTSVAVDNVTLYADLERRILDRTQQLEMANSQLEAFSYSISHDLRAPLRSIQARANMLATDHAEALDMEGHECVAALIKSSRRMSSMIEGLLRLGHVGRAGMKMDGVDLSAMAAEIADSLQAADPGRQAQWQIEKGMKAWGDAVLLRSLLENLLGNAWKYSAKKERSQIGFRRAAVEAGEGFEISDNGAGFDLHHAKRLFQPFQRFHHDRDFAGTGVGLATCHRIVSVHGGRLWADSAPGEGARFYFTLPGLMSG